MSRPIRVLELRSVAGTGGGPEKTILLSAARMRHVAFEPYVPEDHPPAFPVGFPVPFGGPAA